MTNDAKKNRKVFVLGQPLFRLTERNPEARWLAATGEAEPEDEARRKGGFSPAFRPPAPEGGPDQEPAWERLERDAMVQGLAGRQEEWRRVAVVCGAGLGKTTNLQWLEAAVSHRGRQLACFLELKDLARPGADLMALLLGRMKHVAGLDGPRLTHDLERLSHDLERRRRQGRITLLLDSLDQAGPASDGAAVQALRSLLSGVWSACPVWVSGRPHAFRLNAKLFREDPQQCWEFLRIGQLDEPECRFLLETARAEHLARRQERSR